MSAGQVVGEAPMPGTTPTPDGWVGVAGAGAEETGALGELVRTVVPAELPGAVLPGDVVVVRGAGAVVPGAVVAGARVVGAAGCWLAGAGAPEPAPAAVVDTGRT
jgi:hypothetical protein